MVPLRELHGRLKGRVEVRGEFWEHGRVLGMSVLCLVFLRELHGRLGAFPRVPLIWLSVW